MSQFDISTRFLSGKAEENHEDPTSGYLVSGPRTQDLHNARLHCYPLEVQHDIHVVFITAVCGWKHFESAADI
jgi:hypothetical protein